MNIALVAGLLAVLQVGDGKPVIDVWPGKAPGDTGDVGEEKFLPLKEGQEHVARLSNVSHPTLTLWRAPEEKNTGSAVIIAPGGGYHILAWTHEGTEVAKWLNSIGVTGIVLKYSVPRRKDDKANRFPLLDAQRAIRLVRARAEEWKIDPGRIGILGFSAGGNLAARTTVAWRKPESIVNDAVDKASCRPDFAVLVYPAYLVTDRKKPDTLQAEFVVDTETPPVFFAHAGDDRVPAAGSILFYAALKKAGVPAELHVYGSGGHGFGITPGPQPCRRWPDQAADWLRERGLLEKK